MSVTKNTSVRLPKGLLDALATLPASNSASARKAIAHLRNLEEVVRVGSGTWEGPSVITSFRLTPTELRALNETAEHLGITRQATLGLALGAYATMLKTLP
jgi:hypothetical protein